MIAAKDWDGITALTKEAVSTMLGFKLLHVGVNNASEEVAAAESAKFATLLGENVKVGNSSMFVGSLIEMMKNPGRGTNGHICIQTNYLDRAIYHLEKRGFVFDESSFKYNDKGELTVAYLKDEIAGFAVHFNQK
jgi:2-dehydro-3-deoxyphosphogluconate aldolase/(4S)-4-hydroxy-2-oxoglutarate aldolase